MGKPTVAPTSFELHDQLVAVVRRIGGVHFGLDAMSDDVRQALWNAHELGTAQGELYMLLLDGLKRECETLDEIRFALRSTAPQAVA